MEAKIRRGRLLREIFKQERLAPLPIEFQLAWMVAYNEGLFDTLALDTIAPRLGNLARCVAQGSLSLGDSREAWRQAVTGWLQERGTP